MTTEHIEIAGDGFTSRPSNNEIARREKVDAISAHREFYRRREPDSGIEDLVGIYMDENNLDHDTAVSVLATTLEHRARFAGRGSVDSGDVRGIINGAKGIIERAEIIAKSMIDHGGNVQMVTRCKWLLLDFPSLAGATNVNELVVICGGNAEMPKQYRSMKSTVNKCLSQFQGKIPELPLIPGQRNYEQRKGFSNVQFGIWHGKK